MYSSFQLTIKYLRYYFSALNGRGHGIHSPFVYDFVRNVLLREYHHPVAESVRRKMLADERKIKVTDFGAGAGDVYDRKVSQIATRSLKQKKYASLLQRIAAYYQSRNIIELGTSLGVTTIYLASVPDSRVTTLEGAAAVADIAEENFKTAGLNNINVIRGDFDNTMKSTLEGSRTLDLAYVDGNHKLEPTMRYFSMLLDKIHDHSIIVFDDIHWSNEMEEAWMQIKNHPSVTLSIDLFMIGIVFFRKEFKVKQHFCIRF